MSVLVRWLFAKTNNNYHLTILVKELLLKAAAGDEKAFSELYIAYQPVVIKMITAFGSRMQSHAEDITQDIFLALWNRRESLSHIESFGNYLFISVRNRMISEKTKTSGIWNSIEEMIFLNSHEDNGTKESIDFRETRKLYHTAINLLPQRARHVMMLGEKHDMNISHIADAMGISPLTVKNHRQLAMKRMRAWLRHHVN